MHNLILWGSVHLEANEYSNSLRCELVCRKMSQFRETWLTFTSAFGRVSLPVRLVVSLSVPLRTEFNGFSTLLKIVRRV